MIPLQLETLVVGWAALRGFGGPICEGWTCTWLMLMILWLQGGIPVGILSMIGGIWWYRRSQARRHPRWPPTLVLVLGVIAMSYPCLSYAQMYRANVQFAVERRELLAQVPFTVYRATYLPQGYEMSNYAVREYSTSPETAIVRATIRLPGSAFAWGVDTAYASHYYDEVWAEVHQMRRLASYPMRCPGWYFEVEYQHGVFEDPCMPLATTRDGTVVYQTNVGTSTYPPQSRVSVARGETLIAFKIPQELAPGQREELVKIIESFEPFELDDLLRQAD